MNKSLVLFVVAVLVILFFCAWMANEVHTKGREKCSAAQGIWFDRELKCIVGKDIREVK